MEIRQLRIKDLGEVVGGGTPSTDCEEYWGGNIPWLSPKDLTNYKFIYIDKGEQNITEIGYKKSSTKLLPKDTILFSSRAPIGYIAIAKNPICTNQGFKSIVCNKEIINNVYFYYYLKINTDYLKQIASGATFPELSGNVLKKVKVNIFSDIKYQEKVANVLLSYDQLIENNTKRIKLLEKTAEELYKEWFVRFRFPGYENAEFEHGIPKGWKIGKLFELCEFKRGKNITSDEMIEGIYPVVSAGMEPSGYHNQFNVDGYSITISASGANAGYIKFNKTKVWAADCSYISSANTKNIYYIYELLNNLRAVITNLQVGAAQPHVYSKDVNKIKLLIPSDEIIVKANNKLQILHKKIMLLEKSNQNLSKQRDLLVPRLMSGKLEVK